MLKYLALGDSYTIGEQVAFKDNFPSQLVQRLRTDRLEVTDPVIIATTGWTTDELQAAIREQNLQETFSFVSLLIGVNNQYRGRPADQYAMEFSQLLDQAIVFANGQSQHVFVLSIPDWGVTPFAEGKDRSKIAEEIEEYNKAAREITVARRSHFIDITDSTRANSGKEEYLVADQLHPSALEYTIWADRLAKAVLQQFQQ
jgi:lysophospholipase L1-like esterase